MTRLRAIDPPTCSCTDCITGYSKPLDEATTDDIRELVQGNLDNRAGKDDFVIYTITTVEYGYNGERKWEIDYSEEYLNV